MKLGDKLYDLRNKKGLKQAQLAIDIQIAQSTYCDWENNKSVPRRNNLKKIAEYYNLQIDDLEKEIFANESMPDIEELIGSSDLTIEFSVSEFLKLRKEVERLSILVDKLSITE